MNFDASAKGKVKAKFEGLFHQPSIALCAGLIFVVTIILLVLFYIYPAYPVFALSLISVLVIAVLGYLGLYLWRCDSTESLSVSPDGTVTVKSPSKQLIPTLIKVLAATTNRPDKLIPQGIDPKEDPSKFQTLSESQRIEIVKKEVEEAVLQHPLLKNNSSMRSALILTTYSH